MDGPVYRIGTEIADLMILTVYWIVCSLPILTVGASTSAVFYVYGKKARGEDAYVSKDFWKSFKQNLKPSIPITIILIILWLSSTFYVFILRGYGTKAPVYLSGIALFFAVEVTAITIYSLAVLSRFYMKTTSIFLTAFVLAHKHLLTTALIIVFIIGINFATLVMPILFIFIPVVVFATSSFLLQKVFTKHIKAMEDMKKVTEEAKEDQMQESGLEEAVEDEMQESELEETIEDEIQESELEEATENKMQESELEEGLDNVTTEQKAEEDKDFLKYI